MFYYLKHQLDWDAGNFGYLFGFIQAASTVMALFAYPLLKNCNFHDTTLALIGLCSKMAGRWYIAIIWSTASAFGLVFWDMFGRFAAAALKSLISHQVDSSELGKIFSLIAITEGLAMLFGSVFNFIFPRTLDFLPQLCYIILGCLMILPTVAVFAFRKSLGEQAPTGLKLDYEKVALEEKNQSGLIIVADPDTRSEFLATVTDDSL